MARPHGTTKPDSLVQITVTLSVSKETAEWYKSLPERANKSEILREAIALYRKSL